MISLNQRSRRWCRVALRSIQIPKFIPRELPWRFFLSWSFTGGVYEFEAFFIMHVIRAFKATLVFFLYSVRNNLLLSRLDVYLRKTCDPGYYGAFCRTHCVSKPDVYSCDANGNRVCKPGMKSIRFPKLRNGLFENVLFGGVCHIRQGWKGWKHRIWKKVYARRFRQCLLPLILLKVAPRKYNNCHNRNYSSSSSTSVWGNLKYLIEQRTRSIEVALCNLR